MQAIIRRFLWGEAGVTSVEYAVLLAMIIATLVSSIGFLGTQAGGYWGGIRNQLVSFGVGG